MYDQNDDPQKGNRVIIPWLTHHDPKRNDFNNHVIYIFKYAVCLGCSAFILGTILALILGNLFYSYIINSFGLGVILSIFFICWIPSIFQYSVQIMRKKPIRNRTIKFTIRFLYPIGSIILIFKSPLLGFGLAIPAGYFILYIRKLKDKTLTIK